jgi:hypothetical protein
MEAKQEVFKPKAFVPWAVSEKTQRAMTNDWFNLDLSFGTSRDLHMHPRSAFERRHLEALALGLCGDAKVVVDVGGNADRQQERPNVHCCVPALSDADDMRVRRYREHKCQRWCVHKAEDCTCVTADIHLFVHSIYYFTPDAVLRVLRSSRDGVAYSVHHVFEDGPLGSYYNGEAKYQFYGTFMRMWVAGNNRPYEHVVPSWLTGASYYTDGRSAMTWTQVSQGPTSVVVKLALCELRGPGESIVAPTLSAILRSSDYWGYIEPPAPTRLLAVGSAQTVSAFAECAVFRDRTFSAGSQIVVGKNENVVYLPKSIVLEAASLITYNERNRDMWKNHVERCKRLSAAYALGPHRAEVVVLLAPLSFYLHYAREYEESLNVLHNLDFWSRYNDVIGLRGTWIAHSVCDHFRRNWRYYIAPTTIAVSTSAYALWLNWASVPGPVKTAVTTVAGPLVEEAIKGFYGPAGTLGACVEFAATGCNPRGVPAFVFHLITSNWNHVNRNTPKHLALRLAGHLLFNTYARRQNLLEARNVKAFVGLAVAGLIIHSAADLYALIARPAAAVGQRLANWAHMHYYGLGAPCDDNVVVTHEHDVSLPAVVSERAPGQISKDAKVLYAGHWGVKMKGFMRASGLVFTNGVPSIFSSEARNELTAVTDRVVKSTLPISLSAVRSFEAWVVDHQTCLFPGLKTHISQISTKEGDVALFARWNQRFPVRQQRLHAQAYMSRFDIGTDAREYLRKAFIKVEKIVTHYKSTVKQAKPRLIMGAQDVFNVHMGPLTLAYSDALKLSWTRDHFLVYAAGMNLNTLGRWATDAGAGKTYALESDISSWDASLTPEHLIAMYSIVTRVFKAPQWYVESLVRGINLRAITPNGLRINTWGRVKSGDPWTSLFNTLLQLLLSLYVYCEVTGYVLPEAPPLHHTLPTLSRVVMLAKLIPIPGSHVRMTSTDAHLDNLVALWPGLRACTFCDHYAGTGREGVVIAALLRARGVAIREVDEGLLTNAVVVQKRINSARLVAADSCDSHYFDPPWDEVKDWDDYVDRNMVDGKLNLFKLPRDIRLALRPHSILVGDAANRHAYQLCWFDLRGYVHPPCMVGMGDDNLTFIPETVVVDAAVAAWATLGFKCEAKLRTADELYLTEFCSNLMWPSASGIVPAPKPTLVLRAGWQIGDAIPDASYVRVVALGLLKTVNHIPFLKKYVDTCLRLTEGAACVGVVDDVHKWRVVEAAEVDVPAYQSFMLQRYGWSPDDEKNWAEMLDSIKNLPAQIHYPRLEIIIETDYPELGAPADIMDFMPALAANYVRATTEAVGDDVNVDGKGEPFCGKARGSLADATKIIHICKLCGKRGHLASSCDVGESCDVCKATDHGHDDCPRIKRCRICSSPSHLAARCPDNRARKAPSRPMRGRAKRGRGRGGSR